MAAAAMLSGAVLALTPEGTSRQLVRLLCGMVLTLCVLRPLASVEFPEQLPWPDPLAASTLAAQGEKDARDAMADIIRSRCQAYILDKAAALGARLEVEVVLDEGSPPLPRGAVLRGSVSPYAKGQLERILSSQLGITKERQQWSG